MAAVMVLTSSMMLVALGTVTTQAGDTAASKPVKIVAFGDSLTAGYMLEPSASFPAQLEEALKQRGHFVKVENSGVSGDTTAAALARLDWAIPPDTDAVIVELGANDALRGINPALAKQNLDEILKQLTQRDLKVLLTGMIAPKNWGAAYSEAFDPIFAELAETYNVLYYPFFLDGVATNAALNLDDGMHPNREGVAEIVKRILPKVEELIAEVKAERG